MSCKKKEKKPWLYGRNKKGSVMLYLTFLIAVTMIILITAVFAPLGVRFNSAMYIAGQNIINESMSDINNISDPTIRAQVNATLTAAMAAGADNIEVNASLFRYSWIFIVVLTALIIFIYTRRLTEIQTGLI